MSGLPPFSRLLFKVLLRCCPADFRRDHALELLETLARREADYPDHGLARARFRLREGWALLRAGWSLRQTTPSTLRSRALTGGTPLPIDAPSRLLVGFWGDFNQGLRSLRRHPTHALVGVLTLGIACGAATAVFSVLDAVVLEPLPYAEPERLVYVRDSSPPRFPTFSVTPGRFVEWQERARDFYAFGATNPGSVSLTGEGDPQLLPVAFASASLFDVLRVQPMIGRTFTAEEDLANGPRAILLSAELWRSAFDARRDLVGEPIEIDGEAVTVVGVMPPGFDYPSGKVRAWLPLKLSERARRNYGSHYLQVVARVADGPTIETARADLERAARELAIDEPLGNESWTVLVEPMHEVSIRDVRRGVMLLVAAALGVLLIACANVAGLLLARGADREREIAVRAALGAGRKGLVRLLLAESMMIGLAGALLGVLIAFAILRGLLALSWSELPRLSEMPLDWSAFAFAAALGLLTPLAFGLLPALRVSSVGPGVALGSGRSGSTIRASTRSALIVGEIAVAVVLVAGSGLMLRSLDRLLAVEPGFEPERLLAIDLSLPGQRYPGPEERAQFFSELVALASSTPGVTHAASSQASPFLNDYVAELAVEGDDLAPDERSQSANFYSVSPGYFETMGIPLLAGRDFVDADRDEAPRVAIVSQRLVDERLGGGDALGRRVRTSQGPRPDFAEVIGVVGDVRQYGLDRDATMQIYEPAAQHPYFASQRLLVRGTLPLEDLTESVRRLTLQLDPALPIGDSIELEVEIARSTGPRRFTAAVLGGLALVALLLAAVGIYALVSFTVGRRVQELGLRMALGARPGSIVPLVMGQGLKLAALGVTIGLAGALAAGRLVDSLLFEVSARDPLALGVASVVLVAATALACIAPATRALRVDPVVALKE